MGNTSWVLGELFSIFYPGVNVGVLLMQWDENVLHYYSLLPLQKSHVLIKIKITFNY